MGSPRNAASASGRSPVPLLKREPEIWPPHLFEMAPADVKVFERQLPCRLGPEETGPPAHALVGTNDRSWYRVEAVNKHRSCLYHHDIRTAEFLLDLDDPTHVTVYAVISND